MHCGASVSELFAHVGVALDSMVVTYVLHVCNVYMHNEDNLRFIQNYASAVWIESPMALSSLR